MKPVPLGRRCEFTVETTTTVRPVSVKPPGGVGKWQLWDWKVEQPFSGPDHGDGGWLWLLWVEVPETPPRGKPEQAGS